MFDMHGLDSMFAKCYSLANIKGPKPLSKNLYGGGYAMVACELWASYMTEFGARRIHNSNLYHYLLVRADVNGHGSNRGAGAIDVCPTWKVSSRLVVLDTRRSCKRTRCAIFPV